MKYITTSTLLYDSEFAKLRAAYSESELASLIEKRFELLMEAIVIDAEKRILDRNININDEEIA